MALNKIKRDSITADAITEAKIADNAVENEHLNSNVINSQTELSETSNNSDELLVYDASAGALKKITRQNLILEVPTISSVSPTNVSVGDGTGNYTFVITGTKFDGTATASLRDNTGGSISFDTVTRDSSTQITGVVAKSSLDASKEPFDVRVVNGSGLAADLTNQININAAPTFVTAAGSLGSFSEQTAVNVTINAVDPESAGNVTFELLSGSLPAGLNLTTEATEGGTARISGTLTTNVSSSTTSTFRIRAIDAASNTSIREFSITELPSGTQSFTSSGTFSVPTGITSVDVLVVGGGGGGGNPNAGGGGAGGLVFVPGFTVTPGGTVTVTVGCGGGAQTSQTVGNSGQDSVFGTLTAKGGGAGGGGNGPTENTPIRNGEPGGSSGGGGAGEQGFTSQSVGGSATQPTQSGQSGAYGFGNIGGTASGRPAPQANRSGGGGGGAGGAGGNGAVNPSTSVGGQGGVGKAYTIADGTTSVYYAGGGGGGTQNDPGPSGGGSGGQGGGGNGGYRANSQVPGVSGQAGTANRGGGGGGGASSSAPGKAGGKGIVIVKF